MREALQRARTRAVPLPELPALERPRVVEALRRAMQRTVTLVAAPRGYGKSRAVAAALGPAGLRNVAFDALSLSDAAREVAHAVAPGAAGLQLAFGACARRALASDAPADVFAGWIAEYARAAGGTIVLDGLDAALSVTGVPRFLAALVARTGSSARWVLVTRDLEPLPVARWLAEGLAGVPVDETVLGLRPDELRRYSDARGVDRSALVGVEPRPATVALACDLLVSGTARRAVAAHARSLTELVGLAFADDDADGRRVVALAAHLGTVDAALLAALPVRGAAELFERVRRRLPSAFEGDQLEPWFRSVIRERIAEDPRYARAAAHAAAAYETCERPLGALRVALQRGDDALASAVVRRAAPRLLDGDLPPEIATAFERDGVRVDTAPALALRAAIASLRGRDDEAAALFSSALASAEQPARTAIVHRFAQHLMARNPQAAIALLEAHAASAADPLPAPVAATLATAYAQADRHADAQRTIEDAAARCDLLADPAHGARFEYQRAVVALRRGDADVALTATGAALALAEKAGAYDVAACAHVVAYELAADADEPFASLGALERVARDAARAGENGLRTFALLGAYDLHASSGDEDAMRRIEEELADFDVTEPADGVARTLLPGRALAHAWRGAFERASGMLGGTGIGEPDPARRAIRHAEVARYAAAAGIASQARDAIAAAEAELHQVTESAWRDRVVASLALASVLLGDDDAAARRLPSEPAGESARRTAVLLDAVALYRSRANGRATAPELIEVLDRTRERGFGGFARLIEALPRRPLPPPSRGGSQRT